MFNSLVREHRPSITLMERWIRPKNYVQMKSNKPKKQLRGRKLDRVLEKRSFCQRLVLSLDFPEPRQEPEQRLRKQRRTPKRSKTAINLEFPTPLILALPAELRQSILYHSLDDDQLLAFDPITLAQPFTRVCTTFQADLEWVSHQWYARKEDLQSMQPVKEKGAFDDYIADLMTPVMSASRAMQYRKGSRKSVNGGHHNRRTSLGKTTQRRNQMKKSRPHRGAHNDRFRADYRLESRSPAERIAAQKWRAMLNAKPRSVKVEQ